MVRLFQASLCIIAVVVAGGCEKKTSVTGKVTYNATPIENGYISFSPKGSGQTVAGPITDGKYAIEEAKPGHYTAIVVGRKKINHYSTSAEAYANAAKSAHVSEAADYIAEQADGNSKEVEFHAGAQSFDFAISGPAAPKN
jgi:hypothetical protein